MKPINVTLILFQKSILSINLKKNNIDFLSKLIVLHVLSIILRNVYVGILQV